MENLLVVVAIIYFVANVFSRSTKKSSSNEFENSFELPENEDKHLDIDVFKEKYFLGNEESFGVNLESTNEENLLLEETLKENEVKNFDDERINRQETYKDGFVIKKKRNEKRLNVSRKALRNAVVMSEILGKPVSMK